MIKPHGEKKYIFSESSHKHIYMDDKTIESQLCVNRFLKNGSLSRLIASR